MDKFFTELSHLINGNYLKRASPKAANIHNLTASKYIQTAGARMKKYEVDRTAYSDGCMPDNDIVLFRYADVLLMRAEAEVRNGGDGYADMNAVRARVGMAPRLSLIHI